MLKDLFCFDIFHNEEASECIKESNSKQAELVLNCTSANVVVVMQPRPLLHTK